MSTPPIMQRNSGLYTINQMNGQGSNPARVLVFSSTEKSNSQSAESSSSQQKINELAQHSFSFRELNANSIEQESSQEIDQGSSHDLSAEFFPGSIDSEESEMDVEFLINADINHFEDSDTEDTMEIDFIPEDPN